jgi:hypothetical protein
MVKTQIPFLADVTARFAFALFSTLAWSQSPDVIIHSTETNEVLRWRHEDNGVRVVLVTAPAEPRFVRRRLILFATPNGNTLEQTLGCKWQEGMDWRFDIQHVAAQVRKFRSIDPSYETVLAVVQAPQLSWPEFRKTTQNANHWIRILVESLQAQTSADETVLACHSGGGSFLWGWMNAHETLPNTVSRIIFLDANYSYSDEDHHGDKMLKWLNVDGSHRLEVLAYDDREITLDGKKVIGDDGGTFRATHRMIERFQKDMNLAIRRDGDFQFTESMTRNVQFMVHGNPNNEILHTKIVGEMNGLLYALTAGSPFEAASQFGGPRSYNDTVQSNPFIDPWVSNARIVPDVARRQLELPPRPHDAESGTEFVARIATMDRKKREEEILNAILQGNVPAYSRFLVPIEVSFTDSQDHTHSAKYFASTDYLAIGSDVDSIRMPMTPATATAIGNALDCTLITPKISDDLFAAAQVRLSPHPLTIERDLPKTFLEHHQRIESQLLDAKLIGETRDHLIVGIKKDIVWSRKLLEKTHKVAIYGWHNRDGRPIQSVYCGHVDWYTDYSHGLRLIHNRMEADGKSFDVKSVFNDPIRHRCLSREGPLDIDELRRSSQW